MTCAFLFLPIPFLPSRCPTCSDNQVTREIEQVLDHSDHILRVRESENLQCCDECLPHNNSYAWPCLLHTYYVSLRHVFIFSSQANHSNDFVSNQYIWVENSVCLSHAPSILQLRDGNQEQQKETADEEMIEASSILIWPNLITSSPKMCFIQLLGMSIDCKFPIKSQLLSLLLLSLDVYISRKARRDH